MTNINYEYVEEYLDGLIEEEGEILPELRKIATENHIPILEPTTAEFIRFLLSVHKPKRILELGTAIGYSAIVFANATSNLEYLKTVEIRQEFVDIARENIKRANLSDKITVEHSDADDFLENLDENFDFIFIDAAKGQYEYYFEKAIKHLNKGGIILCDNVLFRGMIPSDALVKRRKITIVKRLRRFLPKIKKDTRYISSIVPIGDGILLIKRRNEDEES